MDAERGFLESKKKLNDVKHPKEKEETKEERLNRQAKELDAERRLLENKDKLKDYKEQRNNPKSNDSEPAKGKEGKSIKESASNLKAEKKGAEYDTSSTPNSRSGKQIANDMMNYLVDHRYSSYNGNQRTTVLPDAPKTTVLNQNRTSSISTSTIRSRVSKYGMAKYNDIGRYVGNNSSDTLIRNYLYNSKNIPLSDMNKWLDDHK